MATLEKLLSSAFLVLVDLKFYKALDCSCKNAPIIQSSIFAEVIIFEVIA